MTKAKDNYKKYSKEYEHHRKWAKIGIFAVKTGILSLAYLGARSLAGAELGNIMDASTNPENLVHSIDSIAATTSLFGLFLGSIVATDGYLQMANTKYGYLQTIESKCKSPKKH